MKIFEQFMRFCGVGGLCTLLQYLILIFLVTAWNLHPIAASSIGYVLSGFINYQLNRKYTFRSDAALAHTFPRFLIITIIGLLMNAAVLKILHAGPATYYMLDQIAATGATTIWNFFANRAWTFSRTGSFTETAK